MDRRRFDSPLSGLSNSTPAIATEMDYPWEQRKGQRHFGPPRNWIGSPPKGTEVFIGKIPRDSDENELVPLFGQVGRIYSMRIMMDFSGFNRGFAFVRYSKKSEAYKAVEMFNGSLLRGNRRIGVALSVDNSRLFIGGLPKSATKDDVFKEFHHLVQGLVNIIMYPNPKDAKRNRGFAFLEFDSHHSAAAARRDLIPCPDTSFGKLMVDWAEPEPDIDEKIMEKVKILYVRNLNFNTTEQTITKLFNCVIRPAKIEKVKKINDYAFVHFNTRADAEKALGVLANSTIDESAIEIQLARPVEDRSLYKLKKMINKGFIDESMLHDKNNYGILDTLNQCFNKNTDDDVNSPVVTSPRMIRKLPSNRYTNESNKDVFNIKRNTDKSFSNDCVISINDKKHEISQHKSNSCDYLRRGMHLSRPPPIHQNVNYRSMIQHTDKDDYIRILDNICKHYKWQSPLYNILHPTFSGFNYLHYCIVTLHIGAPFSDGVQPVGPIWSTFSYPTEYEAYNDAAKNSINYIDRIIDTYNNARVACYQQHVSQ